MMRDFALPAWLILPLGPIVGSWLGVVIRRWPAGRPMVFARSACDSCGHKLGATELVPVFSYLAQGGRCRHCDAPIGWFAPAVELAALAVGAAALGVDGPGPVAWVDAALGWALLAAAWIDAESFLLPDFLTLPLVLAGLAATAWLMPAALTDHALAACTGYLGFRALDYAYLKLRNRPGLGAGDAKLLGAAGAWVGLTGLPYIVFLAACLGILWFGLLSLKAGDRRPHQPLPFGPALALAFFVCKLASP